MRFKKFLLVLFFYILTFTNSYSIEPDVFVQSTVNEHQIFYQKIFLKRKKLMN